MLLGGMFSGVERPCLADYSLVHRPMSRATLLSYLMSALAGAGCTADREPEEAIPNPIEQRIEPARQQAAQADSAARAREQQVRELTGEPAP